MAQIDDLLSDLDGGLLLLNTEHRRLRASCIRADGAPGPDVYMLDEAGADFVLLTFEGRVYFEVIRDWHFPVGSERFPVEQWYIATVHDLTGAKNDGYKHSGVDYNVEVPPRGDIDRGQPVWAVADGTVYGTWYSEKNLASVVIEVQHDGAPLWVRYWHLDKNETFLGLRPGMAVRAGQCLGHLGDYSGGDHLHFDMALDAFHPGVWLVAGVRWVDPVPILKAHLDPATVEASLRIG